MANKEYERKTRAARMKNKERQLSSAKRKAEKDLQNAKDSTAKTRSLVVSLPMLVVATLATGGAFMAGAMSVTSSLGGFLWALGSAALGAGLTAAVVSNGVIRVWNKLSPVSRSVAKAQVRVEELDRAMQQIKTLIKNREMLGNDGMPFGGIEADRYAELKLQLENSKMRVAVQEVLNLPEIQRMLENSTDEEVKKNVRSIMKRKPMSAEEIKGVQDQLKAKGTTYKNRSKKATDEYNAARAKVKAQKTAALAHMFDNVRGK